jgi:benzylsuccinate CoA-transferase BbsF subunit
MHAATAILAALYHRRRAGKGQYIEVAQFESSVNTIATALLRYTVNGEVTHRQGNRSGHYAPSAVLRCAGDDRWCTISAHSDEQWQALARAVGKPEWLDDDRYSTVEARLAHESELEQELEAWTSERDPYAVMAALQEAGVPSGVVQTTADLIDRDPSLRERHWAYLDHPEMGRSLYDAPPFKLTRTPGMLRWPAPPLGEDTRDVLEHLLGYSGAEIDSLSDSGVLR